MKKNVIIFILFLLISINIFALDEWADNFGIGSPYGPPFYITGFGTAPLSSGKTEAVEAAKQQAMDDLIRKVRVHVQSEVTLDTSDDGRNYSSSASMVIQSVSDMTLSGLEFLEDQDRLYHYALAYANVKELSRLYTDRGKSLLASISEGYSRGKDALSAGRNQDALNSLIRILPAFEDFYECRAVYRGISAKTQNEDFCGIINNIGYQNIEKIYQLEQEVKGLVDRLSGGTPENIDTTLNTLVTMLELQGVSGSSFQVSSLLYQESDFSSSFGNYISRRLEPLLQFKLGGGIAPVVVRGSYWEKGDDLEIMVTAQELETGKKIGCSYVSLPQYMVPGAYEIKPQNFEKALKTQKQIADGALVDGGLSLDMWTNRGRHEDVLVYCENEILQIYFRVNQPAYLQPTYNLATGEKVMLEEAFYIGIYKVNQVVRYPFAFEIVPPLGVERLMATAYSVKPPAPDIIPQVIEGEEYQVFTSTEAVVQLTRGLKLKKGNPTDVKMGEAFLTITTVPE